MHFSRAEATPDRVLFKRVGRQLPTPKVHFPREEVSVEPDRVFLFKGVGRRQLSKAAGCLVVGAATKASGMPRCHLGTSSSSRSAANSAALCLAPRPAAAAAPCCCCRLQLLAQETSSRLGRSVGMSGGAFNSQPPHYLLTQPSTLSTSTLSKSKQGSWENLTSSISVLQAPNICNQTLLREPGLKKLRNAMH